MFATAYDSLGVQYDKVSAALSDGAALTVASSSLQLLMLALPAAGMGLTFARVGTRAGGGAWSWSEGRPERRALVVTTATAGLALAAFTWWPNGDYRPIQPGERGTIQGGLHSVAAISTGRPSLTPEHEKELGGAPTARELRGDRRLEQTPDTVGEAQRRVEQRKPRDERSDATPTPGPSATPQAGATPEATATPDAAGSTPEPTATPAATATANATPAATATATATPIATTDPSAP
jgi:hypothetical protein